MQITLNPSEVESILSRNMDETQKTLLAKVLAPEPIAYDAAFEKAVRTFHAYAVSQALMSPKIHAIKFARMLGNLSLFDAKEYVEKLVLR